MNPLPNAEYQTYTVTSGYTCQLLKRRVARVDARSGGESAFYDCTSITDSWKGFHLPLDLLAEMRLDKQFIRFFDKFSRMTVLNLDGKPLEAAQQEISNQVSKTNCTF